MARDKPSVDVPEEFRSGSNAGMGLADKILKAKEEAREKEKSKSASKDGKNRDKGKGKRDE